MRLRVMFSAMAVSAGLVIAAAAVTPASAATDQRIVVTKKGVVRSVGGFDPQHGDPSTAAANSIFGLGTVRTESDDLCIVDYSVVGLTISFADFGAPGVGACDPSAGKAQVLTATGPAWRTDRGLTIGDRLRKLKRLYPERRLRKGRYELIGKKSLIGPSGHQTVLSAFLRGHRVSALRVFAGAAGE
jgi:hypothetical protein